MDMVDFTSALYLGMHHPSRSLQPWRQLTLGVPAALAEPPCAGEVALALAELQGCEQAVLMPSTLHLFWDLFGMLSKQPVIIYLDEEAYAIAHWGTERAAASGVAVHRFRHHDPDSLFGQIAGQARSNRRPVVITDGFCPVCGRLAPISDYLEIIRRFGGLLVLDDTQAIGILGEKPGAEALYGSGGGGTLRWSGVFGPDILVGMSLAKGFGVPVAALAGSKRLVRRFTTASDTRVHCSPPSVAVIQAAVHALAVNRVHGDRLRQQLAQRVGQFRKGLALIGRSSTGGWFPVQTLRGIVGSSAVGLHQRLSQRGVQAILSRPHNKSEARLSFLITALHSAMEIDRCIDLLDTLASDVKTPTNLRQMPVNLDYSADWLPRWHHTYSRGES
jgi:8-amino-7-oxononanoate synthase